MKFLEKYDTDSLFNLTNVGFNIDLLKLEFLLNSWVIDVYNFKENEGWEFVECWCSTFALNFNGQLISGKISRKNLENPANFVSLLCFEEEAQKLKLSVVNKENGLLDFFFGKCVEKNQLILIKAYGNYLFNDMPKKKDMYKVIVAFPKNRTV